MNTILVSADVFIVLMLGCVIVPALIGWNMPRVIDWFKKKKKPSTTMRERLEALPVAEKLEAYLNGSEPESVRATGTPDLRSRPAEAGSEPKDGTLVCLLCWQPVRICSCPEGTPALGLTALGLEFARQQRSSQMARVPAGRTSQTSSRRTATPPGKPVSMAPGQTYRPESRQSQTGSETSGSPEETDISALSQELWRGLDNRIKRQRNP